MAKLLSKNEKKTLTAHFITLWHLLNQDLGTHILIFFSVQTTDSSGPHLAIPYITYRHSTILPTLFSTRDCINWRTLTSNAFLTSMASRPLDIQREKIPSSKSRSLYLKRDISTSIHLEDNWFSSPSSLLASCLMMLRNFSDFEVRYCKKKIIHFRIKVGLRVGFT